MCYIRLLFKIREKLFTHDQARIAAVIEKAHKLKVQHNG